MERQRMDLDDDTLRAFGRVAWTAIYIEKMAADVAVEVLARDQWRTPAGVMIDDAVKRIGAAPATPAMADVGLWLATARSALDRRNRLLHGIPIPQRGSIIWVEPVKGPPVQLAETPMQAEVLDRIADEFEVILEGWAGAMAAAVEAANASDAG